MITLPSSSPRRAATPAASSKERPVLSLTAAGESRVIIAGHYRSEKQRCGSGLPAEWLCCPARLSTPATSESREHGLSTEDTIQDPCDSAAAVGRGRVRSAAAVRQAEGIQAQGEGDGVRRSRTNASVIRDQCGPRDRLLRVLPYQEPGGRLAWGSATAGHALTLACALRDRGR